VTFESKDIALLAAEAASDKKGENILALDVSQLLVVTEYFVIISGRTNIQVRAIADEVEEQLRAKAGEEAHRPRRPGRGQVDPARLRRRRRARVPTGRARLLPPRETLGAMLRASRCPRV